MAVLLVAMAVSLLVAAATGRWAAVAVPAILVPLYYVGLKSDWWGAGVGDAWEVAAILVTTGTMVVAAAVVAVRRAAGST